MFRKERLWRILKVPFVLVVLSLSLVLITDRLHLDSINTFGKSTSSWHDNVPVTSEQIIHADFDTNNKHVRVDDTNSEQNVRVDDTNSEQNVRVDDTSILSNDIDVSGYYNLDTIKTTYDDKFLLYNPDFCTDVDVITIVPIGARNVKARNAIRNTYGTISRDRTYGIGGVKTDFTVRVVFVFGKTNSTEDQQLINKEHALYKDILLIDMVDSYYNLTRKMINSFRWIDEFCKNVSYVIKTDDDVFINIPLLLSKVKELDTKSDDVLFGRFAWKLNVLRSGKWLLSNDTYPFPAYPQYLFGTSYTISGRLIGPIVYSAQFFPYVNMEDAFITGIICSKVLGARLEHSESISFKHQVRKVNACEFVASDRIAMSRVLPDHMMSIWDAILDYKKQCRA